MAHQNKELDKMFFPVLTNLRNSKRKVKNIKGKIQLKYDYLNNFVFNDAFDQKKIRYSKNYNNEQSFSSVFQKHLIDVFKIIKFNFKKKDKIIEIGCGKGTFFKILEKNYKYIRGFDTSYEGKNKKIIKRYVTKQDVINEKLIILRHTLEHIPNPYDFLNFLKEISINDPYILIEVPDFEWIKSKQTFFDITYEHVNYFSMKTFENLFSKKLFFKKKVFGKQYLLVIAKLKNLNKNFKKKTKYKNLSINKVFPNLSKQIMNFNNINQNIFVWGAATKGLMFLIYLKKINPQIFKNVKFAVDIDKNKHNKYLQIVDIKIVSPEKLLKIIKNGDTIIVANSNYLHEVRKYVEKFKFENINFKCID
jgi:hypothetical protein